MEETEYLTAREFRVYVDHIDSQFLSFREFFESMKNVPADVAQLKSDMVDVKAELRVHSVILKEHSVILKEHAAILNDHTARLERLEESKARPNP